MAVPDLLSPPIPIEPAEAAEQRQFEQSTAPASDPNAYQLHWYGKADAIPEHELPTLDASLRQFAHATGLPAHVGNGVLSQAVDDLRRLEGISEADLAVHVASQRALLGRLIPGVTAEQIIAGANKVLAKADRQFVEDGRQTGLFSSAALLAQLYLQSLRDELRGRK